MGPVWLLAVALGILLALDRSFNVAVHETWRRTPTRGVVCDRHPKLVRFSTLAFPGWPYFARFTEAANVF